MAQSPNIKDSLQETVRDTVDKATFGPQRRKITNWFSSKAPSSSKQKMKDVPSDNANYKAWVKATTFEGPKQNAKKTSAPSTKTKGKTPPKKTTTAKKRITGKR